ncbi:MAG TPA: GNAT family N-acetyltransferase, partial [Pirellulales bacterium]|nr:GNAT family N-acetyltransferase [Pirellulales bacterium]
PDGHIDCACVHPDFRRQGVVTSLVNHAVDVCFASKINRVYVEASICAKPLFEKAGFRVIAENLVSIGGIEMLNYKMERLRE